MRHLYLLRHAKSSWAEPGLADHERPLAPRGRRDARAIAAHVQGHGVAPDLVVCSTSRRTRETLEPLAAALAGGEVLFEAAVYGATERQLLERVRRIPDRVASAMLIGHSPGLEELCLLLAGTRRPDLRQRIAAKFPTAALATLTIERGGWRALGAGDAELEGFVTPRELG